MTGAEGARPPRVPAWIVGRLAHPSVRTHLLGDLEQEFAVRTRAAGRRRPAARWYWRQAMGSIPYLLLDRLFGRRTRSSAWSAHDLRIAVRALGRNPTFAAIAILTMALGIGANAIVFAFVHGLLLEPLPFPEPDRLFLIEQTRADATSSPWLSIPDVRDLDRESSTFQALSAFTPDAFVVQGVGEPRYVAGAEVSPNYFRVLATRPVAGRAFDSQDDEAARVVIAESLWSEAYGRDPNALGSMLDVDGRPMELIGVVGDAVGLEGDTRMWVPIRTSVAEWRERRGTDWVHALGRLAQGVHPQAANAELRELGARLEQAFPDTNLEQGFAARPLRETLTGSLRVPLSILMGAVATVLLIVCVNLAGLLLARGVARSREIATRLALGASRGRLFGQLLVENGVLAGVGGSLGILLAFLGVPRIRDLFPAGAPRVSELGVDAPVLLFALCLCGAATLVFGLVPALNAIRGDPAGALTSRNLGSSRSHAALRRGLVAGQMALALVLLVGTSLLVRTFARLHAVELGMEPEGVVTARLPLVDADFPSTVERTRHYSDLLRSVRQAPGIEGAALVNALPLRDQGPTFSFATRETTPVPESDRLAGMRAVMGEYFGVMGIAVLSGRSFTPGEMAGEVAAVVVDRTFERIFFPQGAVGREIEVVDASRRIVGVVEAVTDRSPAAPPSPKMYVPLTPHLRQTMAIVARSRLRPAESVDALHRAIRAAEPSQTIQSLLPMEGYRSRAFQRERVVLGVLGVLGVVALLLAALGVYGVLAYLVSLRTREIGVRMALGASAGSVRRSVLLSGARMILVGLVSGVALAAAGARLLQDLLFETPALDPLSFAAAGIVLAATGLVAAYLPALRATRTSPVEALRAE